MKCISLMTGLVFLGNKVQSINNGMKIFLFFSLGCSDFPMTNKKKT